MGGVEAVWFRFRSELRGRWRAWLALAALVGVAAGAVMALTAGASRTDTAYRRFVATYRGFDAVVVNYPTDKTALFDFDELSRLPMVSDAAAGKYDFMTLGTDIAYVAPIDNRIGTELARVKILEGREPRGDQPHEIAVPFLLAERFGVHIGDQIPFFDPAVLDALPAQQRARFRRILRALPGGKMKVVGIEAAPGEFPPQRLEDLPIHATPALASLLGDKREEILLVRFHDGARDYPAFLRALQTRSRGLLVQAYDANVQGARVDAALHVQAIALWIVAAVLAIAALLLLGQLLARQTFVDSEDNERLAALGTTRRQRLAIAMVRAATTGALAAIVGCSLAVGASSLFPRSLARTAEPRPGVAFNASVLALGGITTIIVVLALALGPAWRASVLRLYRRRSTLRPSRLRLTSALATLRTPAAVTVGVGYATEQGGGRTAVPVRTSIGTLVIAAATLTASLTFAASLDHLINTPRLSGLTWDLTLTRYGYGGPLDQTGLDEARQVPGIEAIAIGDPPLLGPPYDVDGVSTQLLALTATDGTLQPPLLEGRAPRRPDEIALSTKALRAAGKRIGSVVLVAIEGGSHHRFRVVGRTFVPYSANGGGWVTLAGERVLAADLANPDLPGGATLTGGAMFLRLAPGASARAVTDRLNDALVETCNRTPRACPDGPVPLGPVTVSQADDVVNFSRVQAAPQVLAIVVVALGVGALAHLLTTAVRRRRRDLALLKTLGFTRTQLRGTVAVQALTVSAMALAVGIPLGIITGRTIWTLRAHQLGIVNEPRVPLVALVAVAIASIALAALIAVVPARIAARARPAEVLRSE